MRGLLDTGDGRATGCTGYGPYASFYVLKQCQRQTEGCLAGLLPVCTQHRSRHKLEEAALRSAYKSKTCILDARGNFRRVAEFLFVRNETTTKNTDRASTRWECVYKVIMCPLPQHEDLPSRKPQWFIHLLHSATTTVKLKN